MNALAQPEIEDERDAAFRIVQGLADQLCGDIVLVPFLPEGTPDWATTSRDTLAKVAHWVDIEYADIDRLAVLTDGFGRWIRDADDVSVVTWCGGGTPVVRQVGGKPRQAAVDLTMDAVLDDEPLATPAMPEPPAKEPSAPDRLAGMKAANDNKTFPVINPAIWQGEPLPQREWFIEGLVPMRQVTILNGDGGVGKSLLALQIAAASALSVDTLGMEPLARRAVYIGAEDEADEFQRRLTDIAAAHKSSLADLFRFRLIPLADRDALLAVPDKAGNMQPTPLWLGIAKYIEELEPGLLVLDTVADLFGGDEIKRGQARQFIGMLRHLAIEVDCAIILLAHPSVSGMTSGTGTSGSTGWSNSARSRLYLTKAGKDEDPDLRILTTMKSNYGETGGTIKLRWRDGAFVLDDGKQAAGSSMLAARAERIFKETLEKLYEQGQKLSPSPSATYAPKVISMHSDAKGISKKELAAAQQRLLDAGRLRIIEEGSPSRRTKHLAVVNDVASD